ncbi:MAG TPA: N-6 DNA methylase [Allocoleopsis sp.]
MSAVGTTLTGVQIEGNLIAPDMTTDLLAGEIKGQTPEDFNFAKTDKLADEIAIAWGDAKAYWAAFQRRLARLDADDMATSLTREQWAVPLLESLGYSPVYTAKAEIVDGQTYAISHRAEAGENKPPIHIVGCRVKLEQRPPSGTPRLSAHTLMQEYLNRTEHLWGIVTNGLQWRLLRDSSLMTRLTYIEFDLEQILNGENFAEFGLFYRLFHRSRLPQGMDDADECLLEYYHQEAIQQGGRVRDRLRDGVEKALVLLGTGFLQHPANQQVRQQFESGELTDKVYYRQLLLLIYRFLFLMVAESRDLLLADEDPEKARIYMEYYSVSRLRDMAERRSYRREGFQDLWQGLRVTFRLFDENWRGEALKLSPLNGDLFGSKTLQDLDACAIDNHDLLLAIRELSLYVAVPSAASRRVQQGQLRRVNYEALDVEELGSVYESLLDFHPQVVQRQGIYEFALVLGSDRKTTGSYYTPPELVGQLIKSALEPVIADKLKGAKTPAEQEAALLSLKVCDPACGSGHFLLAAARRIGKELAKVRMGEAQPGAEPLRKAIRDAIQNCIYGVDLNPLAVDLCKVALWIEGFNRGFPLNFLDHRIKCGNSLVGVLDLDCLKEGIPDEAFKAVTGDDKTLSSQFKKRNKKERETDNKGQLSIFVDQLDESRSQYTQTLRQVGAIDEKTTAEYRQKATQYYQSRQDSGWWRDYSACNLWTAAFFMPLTQQNLQLLPTTAALTQLLRGDLSTQKVVEAANKLAQEKRFFHWCLEFPEAFEAGGFDCVLGNSPWERIKLQEKEFFASHSIEIANAANKAAREKLIRELPKNNPELAQAWEDAKHDADAQGKFIRESDRFLLTATGDINTYSVFAETSRKIISPNGRVGVVVPTGIATDDTCKKFFGDLTQKQAIASLYDFENREAIFNAVHRSYKFSLLTISSKPIKQGNFSFFLTQPRQVNNQGRVFQLSPQDISLMNPNTLTCPIFRTRVDAELTKKIYQRVPVLENERTGKNPWGIFYIRLVHLSDHAEFLKFNWEEGSSHWNVPLYEAKLIWYYDHRFATFEGSEQTEIAQGKAREISEAKKTDINLSITPRYFLPKDFIQTLFKKYPEYRRKWFLVWRDVTNNTNERTCVTTAIPKVAASVKLPGLGFTSKTNPSVLMANLNSLVLDYVVRQKIGGVSLSYFILKQLPIIPPEAYTPEDIEFISSRVLELVYTAWDMQPFAQDMGYDGEPFIWNSQRRALLRAELDAYYAKLYGLTRDELRYILDPADVYGSDFPSETFRVLKNNEIKHFGEYRTQRLVLKAWDRMFGN